MIRHYYYNKQIKKFILGFSNIFTGMQVSGGLDGIGNPIMMDVPIRYGSSDRVTAAMATGNTQNKLHTIPMMSCYMTGLELAPDRLHGVNMTDRRTYLEQGGIFPNDVKSINRVMAIPYNMQMELTIYTSNSDQTFQIIEQILILFDYDLQLQFNDSPFDWTKIGKLYLKGMQNEENYPAGVDKRMIMWTFQFELPVWMSPPIEVRNDLIKSISIQIGDLSNLTLDEVDADGNLVPFGTEGPYTSFTVTGDYSIPTRILIILNNGGTSYTNGNYVNVPLSGGSGTGATADINVNNGSVDYVYLNESGIGYIVGDELSSNSIGVGYGLILTVMEIVTTI